MIINRLVIFQFFWYNITNIMIGSVIMTEENIDIKEETADEEILEEEKKKVLDFFITTLNGMAYGLFSTLIIGTIIATIGQLFLKGNNPFCQLVGNALGDGKTGASYVFQVLTGAGIGVGIALMLKMKPLETIVLAGAGEISAYFSLTTNFVTKQIVSNGIKIGDPLTIYIVCICTALVIKFQEKNTCRYINYSSSWGYCKYYHISTM